MGQKNYESTKLFLQDSSKMKYRLLLKDSCFSDVSPEIKIPVISHVTPLEIAKVSQTVPGFVTI